MRTLTSVADRLLARFVPPAKAQAAPCDIQVTRCYWDYVHLCWYDQCTGYLWDCWPTGGYC